MRSLNGCNTIQIPFWHFFSFTLIWSFVLVPVLFHWDNSDVINVHGSLSATWIPLYSFLFRVHFAASRKVFWHSSKGLSGAKRGAKRDWRNYSQETRAKFVNGISVSDRAGCCVCRCLHSPLGLQNRCPFPKTWENTGLLLLWKQTGAVRTQWACLPIPPLLWSRSCSCCTTQWTWPSIPSFCKYGYRKPPSKL